VIDTTERKKAEETLAEEQKLLRTLVDNLPDRIFVMDAQGRKTLSNLADMRASGGKTMEDVIGKTDFDTYPPDLAAEYWALDRAVLDDGTPVINHEERGLDADGNLVWVLSTKVPLHDGNGNIVGLVGIGHDITERRQVEVALNESRQRYRRLFEDTPVAIWEQDFSELKKHLESLKREGHTDLRNYFETAPQAVSECAALIRYLDVNKAALKLYRADSKEDLFKSTEQVLSQAEQEHMLEDLLSIAEGKTGNSWEGPDETLTGEPLEISLHWSVAPGYEQDFSRVIVTTIDITQRKQAEAALARSEKDYRTLFENMPVGLYRTSADGRILDANLALVKMFGYKDRQALLEANIVDLYVDPASDQKFKIEIEKNDIVTSFVAEYKRPDGTTFWTEDNNRITRDEEGKPLFYEGSLIDITERKRAEEAIRKSERVLRMAESLGHTGSWEQDLVTGEIFNTEENLHLFFGDDLSKGTPFEDYAQVVHPDDREYVLRRRAQLLNEGGPGDIEYRVVWPDGTVHVLFGLATVVRDESGQAIRVHGTNLDITERKQAEKKIQKQLEHLAALRNIDQVVISSFDLRISLTMILNQVIRELGVDAADVLLLNSTNLFLEYTAGVGFHTNAAEKTSVRLGQSYAGRVALERQLIQIPDLKDQSGDLNSKTQLAGENFVCYFGVPLVAKGVVRGVLEVYHRASLVPDQEWLDFLNILANQAALAIDNANLFDNLQRSNIDLTLAYDATIEGWSRAMDLRDKETEGHTLRVTEMTMELAGLFGIKDEEMVGIRRGALLHDIGKMGVPDAILLKPSALTDEEWVSMRKHPAFAFEMLSPIHYLKSAIDIPYCHHEKWDGTGYPRGLKGEQIPLPARIFALVDVWDAVTSDRPYRKAWSKEKAIEHIRSQAGSHFDPRIVQVCLEAGVFERKDLNKPTGHG
jgi:PAS domain S-box-containing protein/putative nucleotidyltransferase with HDIG domain